MPESNVSEPPASAPEAAPQRPKSGLVFPMLLVVAAVVYFGFVGFRIAMPVRGAGDSASSGFLARCRAICERYGLLPTGNLAEDAKAYLEVAQPNKLSDGLEEILADEKFEPATSQEHPLVGQSAPAFELQDTSKTTRRLNELTSGRPLIVVFYYGYFCNHCVAQLFGIDKDLHYFRELGADVVAISADSPEHTAEKFKEYGEFHFPVLSDPDNRIAEAYRVFRPERDGEAELLEHGTFVVDAQGQIVWANHGPEPFLDNKTLLFVLAKATGKLPTEKASSETVAPTADSADAN